MNEKSKAIISVGLIVVILAGAFLYQGYINHGKTIDRAIAAQEEELNSTIVALEEFTFTPYRIRIKSMLETNRYIIDAFAQRDRERLYQLSLPKYEALKRENELFHVMHFHLPDSSTFLRMHDPEFFGDDLRGVRPILDDVHKKQESSIGFEIGRHGAFYRIVEPIFYEKQYIGALEFGIKAHNILRVVEKHIKNQATSYFLASHWQKFTGFKKHSDIARFGQYVVLGHGSAINQHLPRDFNLDEDDQLFIDGEKSFIVHAHPVFRDYQDKVIGGILVIQDISSLLRQKKDFLLRGLVFSGVLLFLAFFALYFTFSSVMDNLLHEVRERKKAEDDLVLGRQRLQIIFDASPAAIFIHNMEGGILDLNQTMLDLYGVEKKEGLTLSITDDYSSSENPLEKLPVFWQEVSDGKPQQFEWIARRPHDGSTFTAQVDLEKIVFGEQEVICATVQDITARKQAEENLASEQERLAVTLRSIGDAVIATDTEGMVVLLNQAAESLTGWSNEEAKGRHSTEVFNIIHEKTGEKCASPVQRVLEEGRIIGLTSHATLLARDGRVRSIADSGAPIRDRESVIIGVVLVFRDVSHEKKIEEELLKVRKLESIGVLAGGIAHDFNNILSAILGNIELAAYRIAEDDKKTAVLLSDARKASKRAAKLTQQLLTFSKGGDPVKEVTTLPELITESANFVLHGSQVICRYSYPEDLWMVDVDSGQISQVVQNIILNAKHAMPEGGSITIDCANVKDSVIEAVLNAERGDFVRIAIHDTGIGIPQEISDKIFDPYFTTKQEGSGLGLAITHSIITKHEGHITVDSIPGKGTTFTIYLPAVLLPGSEVKKEISTLQPMKGARVMVMDDEGLLLDVAQAQLTALGHEAVLVSDGAEAINKYQELQENGTPVDVTIMDLTIPGGMGGQEAVKKLLQRDAKAKIIVASGYSNDPVMANYQDYGFCMAVAKPFDLAELSRVIECALKEEGE